MACRVMFAFVAVVVAASSTCHEVTTGLSQEGACASTEESDASSSSMQLSLLQTEVFVNKLSPVEGIKRFKDAVPKPAWHWQRPSTRAEAAGVKVNGEGDLTSFMITTFMNSFGILVCMAVFMYLREQFPKTYSKNLAANPAPLNSIPAGRFGWMQAAWAVDTSSVMDSVGLDQAMLIEFMNLGMRIFAIIGVPMFCIMGPINCFFGGHAAGNDHMSYFSLGNVVDGSPLYWIHALVVWVVVFIVQSSVYKAQVKFLAYRFQWLRELPKVRAHTIMVEGIPEKYQSDEQLKVFFQNMFGNNRITSSYVVKNAPALEAACTSRDVKNKALAKAQFQSEKEDATPAERELVETYKVELMSLQREIDSLQADVKRNAMSVGPAGYYASTGFVTFESRSDVAFALSVQYSEDLDELAVSIPPDPSSVLWRDLQQDESSRTGLTVLGYLLTAGLYVLYMPAVIWITQIAVRINMGPLQPLWEGFAPTAGLMFMVSFLPTFLINIFRFCFTLKDDSWSQQTLQNWYFLFQVVFVILVTAIGGSVTEFAEVLIESPFEVFKLFGRTMPSATHFYMNYLVLQWSSHAFNLTRAAPLGKYLMARQVFDDDYALELSEPEDQDYYGIGSRSCRMTTNACIGVIYGTLCPPINLVAFVEFLICRIVYGYLLPFAETKKADLGGAFWVQKLRHLFIGNIIYCIVMTGVLLGRASSSGPCIVAAPSLLYVVWSMKKFERHFSWEALPLKELVIMSEHSKTRQDTGQYVQPMFLS